MPRLGLGHAIDLFPQMVHMPAVQLDDIAPPPRRTVDAHGTAHHILARRFLPKPRLRQPNRRLQIVFF